MAVKLRLRREGGAKRPHYRVVAADIRSPRDGRFIEIIGHYHPMQEPSGVDIDNERALYWLRNGAKPTAAVERLLRISGAWEEFKPGDRPARERPEAKEQEQKHRERQERERQEREQHQREQQERQEREQQEWQERHQREQQEPPASASASQQPQPAASETPSGVGEAPSGGGDHDAAEESAE